MPRIAHRRWIAAGLALATALLLGAVSPGDAQADERSQAIDKGRKAAADVGRVAEKAGESADALKATLRKIENRKVRDWTDRKIKELEQKRGALWAIEEQLDDLEENERCCSVGEVEELCASADQEYEDLEGRLLFDESIKSALAEDSEAGSDLPTLVSEEIDEVLIEMAAFLLDVGRAFCR